MLVTTKLILFYFETFDERTRTTRRTLPDQFCFIVTVLLDLYLIPRGISGTTGVLRLTDSILINIGCYGTLVMIYLLCLMLPWVLRMKSTRISTVFDNMVQFDIDMLKLGYTVDHQLMHKYSILSMAVGLSIILLVLCISLIFRSGNSWLDVSAIFPDYWTVFAFTRASVGLNVFGCIFGLKLLFLKARFSLLNQVLT